MADGATYDAVLVGAGAGSMAAAIRLAESGLRPLILERSELVGGATAYSGGVVWAPCNHRMRAKGLADTPAAAMTYLESLSLGRWKRSLAESYVAACAGVLSWIERATELRWMSYPGLPDYFAERPGGKLSGRCLLPQPRLASEAIEALRPRFPQLGQVRESVHFPAEAHPWAGGRALVALLWARVLELGVPYRLGARARRLIVADGAVGGVELEGEEGGEEVRGRLGVLLNTGGFEWNERMSRESVPQRLHPQTPPVGEGDGHLMAAAAGAPLALMDQTIETPAIRPPGELNAGEPLYRLFFQELTRPHSLLVNDRGRRFANETFFQDVARGWREYDQVTGRHPNLPMYFVFDERYRRAFGFPGMVEPGSYLTTHADLDELGRRRGIDVPGLLAQVERLNADAARGADEQLGRGRTAYQTAFAARDGAHGNPTIGAVSTPPFYCMEIFPGTSGHRGGVVIDPAGRVLDTRGEWLRGLYACGSVAAGLITGGSYMSGASVGQALVFGVLAADAMAGREPDFDSGGNHHLATPADGRATGREGI